MSAARRRGAEPGKRTRGVILGLVGAVFAIPIIAMIQFIFGITVLPYAFRAIQSNLDAVPMVTPSEAAHSLGADWLTVLRLVLLPNLRRGVLAASFISVAVVLGEFTIASLLNRNNLQTALLQVSQSDPYAAVIFALLALTVVFGLLLLIGRLGAPRNRRTE